MRNGIRAFVRVVDAFNLVSSDAGIVDRAVYLVDPTQPLATGPGGAVVVPLLANPDFGKPISQNVAGPQFQTPRQIRFGARFEF